MKLLATSRSTEARQSGSKHTGNHFRLRGIVLVACLLVLCLQAMAQEKYLVSTDDGLLSLYDLATNSFIGAVKGSLGLHYLESNLSTPGIPVPGPNNRLVFDVSGAYVSVIDTTINRETNRLLRDVFDKTSGDKVCATTPDGRYLLISFLGPITEDSYTFVLYVIDTTSNEVVHKVDLSSAFQGYTGSVVALNNKAYVFPRIPSPTQKLAVVDLTNFSVSSTPLPAGSFGSRSSVVSPDGSAVLAFEDENVDGKSHLLFISTATDTLVNDIAQTQRYLANSFAISPPGTDPSMVFAFIAFPPTAYAIDLRANSPTYGQVLPDTAVTLDFDQIVAAHGLAVSSGSSRLLVVGQAFSPGPNLDVIDTAKMLNDPQNAIVARVTVDNGALPAAVITGDFSTTPPNTAPTVSGVSGDITNDMSRQIEVTGSNFQPGALVRIGNMDPLQAEVMNGGALSVRVPVNAPAGKALDIIVTNPETNAPRDQQNQSGLLAGQFNILPNPKYQPANQIATVNLDNSSSIYSIPQHTMANGAMPGGSLAPAFNVDAKELYIGGGIGYENDVFAVDLKNNQLSSPIPICSTDDCMPSTFMAASRDPVTGSPVIDYLFSDYSYQLYLYVVDSNPLSLTFHTVIKSFKIANSEPFVDAMAVSPDGKFCYAWDVAAGALDIINLSTEQLATVSSKTLGVRYDQNQIGISPDGKFLVLSATLGPRYTIKVFDLSNPTQPKRFAELVPLPIPNRGFPYVVNYQIVAGKLYATDLVGTVVVFDFKTDFHELGYYVHPSRDFWGGFRLSPDGAYFYATDYINDQVLVFDAAKLSYGRDALLTAIRAPYYPYAIDVSPGTPPLRAAVRK